MPGYRQLRARGKHVNQVVVAIAREIAASPGPSPAASPWRGDPAGGRESRGGGGGGGSDREGYLGIPLSGRRADPRLRGRSRNEATARPATAPSWHLTVEVISTLTLTGRGERMRASGPVERVVRRRLGPHLHVASSVRPGG